MQDASLRVISIAGALALSSVGAFALPLDNSSSSLLFQDVQGLRGGVLLENGGQEFGRFNIAKPGNLTITLGSSFYDNITGGEIAAGTEFSDKGGYNPPPYVTEAFAYFYINQGQGAAQREDVLAVDLGTLSFFDGFGSITTRRIEVGGQVLGDALFTLSGTGQLDWTVSAGADDSFTLRFAQLQVTGADSQTPPGNNVPDGGTTASLMGLAFLALAGLKRNIC